MLVSRDMRCIQLAGVSGGAETSCWCCCGRFFGLQCDMRVRKRESNELDGESAHLSTLAAAAPLRVGLVGAVVVLTREVRVKEERVRKENTNGAGVDKVDAVEADDDALGE